MNQEADHPAVVTALTESSASHKIYASFGAFVIEIVADSPVVERRLREHLVPGFMLGPRPREDLTAAFEIRGRPWQRSMPDRPGKPVTLLNASYSFPAEHGTAWISDDGAIVRNHATGAVLESNAMNTHLTLYAADDEVAFRTAYRILREWQTAKLSSQGYSRLHAAVCEQGEARVAISGHKGAGKSTLLMTLILEGGFKLVGSDRAMIGQDDGRPVVCGLTESLNIGVGTLRRFPALRRFIPQHIDEVPAEELWGRAEKMALSPNELRDVIRFGLAGPRPLTVMVFPEIDRRHTLEIDVLDSEQVAAGIRENLLRDGMSPAYLAPWDPSARELATIERNLSSSELARQVRGLRVRYGPSLTSTDVAKIRHSTTHLPAI